MKTSYATALLFVLTIGITFAYARQEASTSGLGRPPGGQFISCSSENMKRNYRPADVRGGVQLVKQRSDAPCIFNRTWGYVGGRGIWVDRRLPCRL
jgi:hypothetical protein